MIRNGNSVNNGNKKVKYTISNVGNFSNDCNYTYELRELKDIFNVPITGQYALANYI